MIEPTSDRAGPTIRRGEGSAAEVLSGDATWCVLHGDAFFRVCELPENSCDAGVIDPPAGISFMNKSWDDDKGGMREWIWWLANVMSRTMRALKPGAHCVVWALPRTSHWTGMALEYAGFEIRGQIQHWFGSGFPKSLNVSMAIDAHLGVERSVVGSRILTGTAALSTAEKGGTFSSGIASNGHVKEIPVTRATSPEAQQWDGFGTALKPAHEIWWVVRKPIERGLTVAENVLKWGTGALNIDACRIAHASAADQASARPASMPSANNSIGTFATRDRSNEDPVAAQNTAGRWPPDVLLTHDHRCVRTGSVEVKASPTWDTPNRATAPSSFTGSEVSTVRHANGRDGETESVEQWECVDGCPVRILNSQGDESQVARYFPQFTLGEWDILPAGIPLRADTSPSVTVAGTDSGETQGADESTSNSRIVGSGKTPMVDACQRATKSTTKTRTKPTTPPTISRPLPENNTTPTTTPSAHRTASETVSLSDGVAGVDPGSRSIGTHPELRAPITDTASHAPPSSCASGEQRTESTYSNNDASNTETSASRNVSANTSTCGGHTSRESNVDDVDAFLYSAKPSRAERDAGLEHFRGRSAAEATESEDGQARLNSPRTGAGRTGGARNIHPTVKGQGLLTYLTRLVTPPRGVVLTPFCGSGSEGMAAVSEGCRFIGIELSDEDDAPHVSIARARISHVEGREFIPRASLRANEPPKQRNLFELPDLSAAGGTK
jgi:hypothetical protein